ncbi:helix-turn-helix transcriptional regulator [Kitasatospora sp. NPDC091335]|uniref:helix-turn-helix transcriptional regulator n=1 Tax=Kitasatospora sp. NPDC091335 TaxID=3364085 RepID=UPI003806EE45
MPKPFRATTADRRPLATAQELADHLQVPLDTVYGWKHRGQGPKAIKVGRHLRYRWTEVEAWLDDLSSGRAAA